MPDVRHDLDISSDSDDEKVRCQTIHHHFHALLST